MYKINDSLIEQKQKKRKSDFRFIVVLAFIALIMAMIATLNTYVFFNVVVDGSSMRPTLSSGDVLVANRQAGYERGSIVVIGGVKEYWLIKRVIAVEGDNVEIKEGRVYINGNELDEPYLSSSAYTDELDWETCTLGEDEIFYLGDNRTNSSDSRSYGVCKERNIVGVVEGWSLSIRGLNKIIYDIGKFFRGGK